MTAPAVTEALIQKSYGLQALLVVCERASRSLSDAGEGQYRDNITASIADVMDLASDIAGEIHIALERSLPREGGDA